MTGIGAGLGSAVCWGENAIQMSLPRDVYHVTSLGDRTRGLQKADAQQHIWQYVSDKPALNPSCY